MLSLTAPIASVDADTAAARKQELIDSGDPILADAAREIATVDHDAVYERGVDLLIAGLATQLPNVDPTPSMTRNGRGGHRPATAGTYSSHSRK